ncbi:S-layer homology domain-containing protein [Lysinibacillus sp. LZ02]|uniref:CAP and S-layer homology domain-containing protein n=1 Tax=Lysinibacillus sp. LZ02 TaxID=3420668 RepID=UPI003D364D6A
MRKQWIGILAFLVMCQLVFPPMSFAERNALVDVKSTYWAAPSIHEMLASGYMNAYEDGTFKPNQPITRGEVAETLVKALKLPLDASIQLQAKDIPTTHPQYDVFRKLVELHVVDQRKQLNPDKFVTRGQIAKMIAQAFGITVDESNEATFLDTKKGCWAKHYIESLADVGVITGKPNMKYEPYAQVTRAQMAVLMTRALHFKAQMDKLEVAYDYLGKRYITTVLENEAQGTEIVRLVNEEREKNGLSSLIQDPYLNQLATIKVQDMFEYSYFDHESPYYGHSWDMATLYDYEFLSFGENIARFFIKPEDVMAAWMVSDSHRENILKPNYTHIGIAVKKDDNGKHYFIQLFSTK